jgi:hypothetical protein
MAKIFSRVRIVPTWLEAVGHLNERAKLGRTDRNLVLEIERPGELSPTDLAVISAVDALTRAHSDDLNVRTVAATIFPQALYQRHPERAQLYDAYINLMKRGKCAGAWGTYSLRLMDWQTTPGKPRLNQLEQTIFKLNRAAHLGQAFQSAYDVGIVEPSAELGLGDDDPLCELPTFDVRSDGKKMLNMPCLSHLSFKLTSRDTVDLTAVYRSHHYAARALGNLIGLAQLLSFVAKEAQLKTGSLTCISTHAELDVESWGGTRRTTTLLAALTEEETVV